MPVPTYRQIADACGVSASTVSRALNNSPLIPQETRERICLTACEMGWVPNPIVSAFMAHLRSARPPQFHATLAYIIAFDQFKRFEDVPHYHQMHFQGARDRAAGLGYKLEQIWYRDLDYKGRRLSRVLKSRGIPGCIFDGASVTPEHMQSFEAASFAMATWGVGSSKFLLHHAASHHLQDMWLALRKIREYGYERIALVLSALQDGLTDNAFFSAFHYQETHHSQKRFLKHLHLPDFPPAQEPAVKKKIRAWLEKHEPEVIIGETIVLETLNDMGWTVPGKVAFVSLYWSSTWPDIGGVDQRPEVIGSNTVDLVVTQLLQNERGIPKVAKLLLNEGRWVDGISIPRLRERAETVGDVQRAHARVN